MTDLDKAGIKAVRLLYTQKHQAFWVGGIVRNMVLGRDSDNIDIATDASPDQVEKIFTKAGYKTKPVGKQFGSILVILEGQMIEITTFRSEGFYSDKRHPDKVNYISDYKEDAKRRDLTINALYYNPIKKELFDPTNGQKDIKGKLIRFVGDPKKRIDEDSLRMLRAVRFATELGFKLESNTFAAIKTRSKFIQGVSGERIKKELDKILLSKNRALGIKLLDGIGLLKFIIPEFEPLKKFSHGSKIYHLEGTQFDHTLLAIASPKIINLDLIYALLFHDIGKPKVARRIKKEEGWILSTRGHNESSADIFAAFAKKYKFPKENAKTTEWLIRNHMLQTTFAEMQISKQIKLATHKDFKLLIEHWKCDEAANERTDENFRHTLRYEKSNKIAQLMLESINKSKRLIEKLAKGELIMKYSDIKPGPRLGEKIEEIRNRIILGEIKTEKDLKNFLQQ